MIIKHFIDCTAAVKEIFAISDSDIDNPPPLGELISPFINQLGSMLRDCYLETSSLSQCPDLSRKDISVHILTKFPELAMQKMKEEEVEVPLMHYAVYNSREVELIRSLAEISTDSLLLTDSNGALPLHWAGVNNPTIPLLYKHDIHSFILEKCPTSIFHEDDEGLLPLHWAVNHDSPDVTLVTQLVELSRESVSKPSNKGHLPLHLAVNRAQPVLEVVVYLLECYPEGIRVPCQQGWLPLHYCVNRADVNLSILKILVDRYPEAVNYRSDIGQLPIHRLLNRSSPAKRAAKYLIQTDPSTLRVADNEGYLPLHTLLSAPEPPASSLVKLMIHSSYSTVRERTNDGWLPVHLAMKLSEHIPPDGDEATDPIVKRVLETQNSDVKTSLPLQRVVAILQELLSIYPESLDEYVVDMIPLENNSERPISQLSWKKIRWTPMSYALAKGKNSILARALRPFRKKAPLTPVPPVESGTNLILPHLSRSPPRHAASTGALELSTPGGFQTPNVYGTHQRPRVVDYDAPLIHYSSFASPQTPNSPSPIISFKSQDQKSGKILQDLHNESFSDLV